MHSALQISEEQLQRAEKLPAPLLEWYHRNKRSMPWRDNPEPYWVWLSEIMLQQTRVEAVRAYFARFVETCPDVATLAALPQEQVLKLWEGLGYYSRAINLHKAAQLIVSDYGGIIPGDYQELRKLPGIGEYTAGAIASIAFGIPVPAADGNVYRVFARYLASRGDITTIPVRNAMRDLAAWLVQKQDIPGDFNQALMELGAIVCLPNGIPQCLLCPLQRDCAAHAQGCETELPVKTPKKPRTIEQRVIVLVQSQEGLLLFRRPSKGLLRGMYEPLNLLGERTSVELTELLRQYGADPIRLEPLGAAKHIFSHVEWRMQGWKVKTDSFPAPEGALWVRDFQQHSIASAFKAYLTTEMEI